MQVSSLCPFPRSGPRSPQSRPEVRAVICGDSSRRQLPARQSNPRPSVVLGLTDPTGEEGIAGLDSGVKSLLLQILRPHKCELKPCLGGRRGRGLLAGKGQILESQESAVVGP